MARTIDDVYDRLVAVEIKLDSHIAVEENACKQSRKWQDYAANLLTGIVGGFVVWLAERFKS